LKSLKLIRASGTLSLVALSAMAGSFAMADDSGWYVGGNIGQSRAKIDDPKIASSLLGEGFSTSGITDDDRHVGFKLFGGYLFNRHFALEGGYFDLGEFGYTANTVPAGTLSGEIKLKGVNLDAVGILPFTQKFSGFGRVGLIYADAKDRFTGTGAVNVTDPDPGKRRASYSFGVGLEYDVIESVGLRAEAQRYRINDAVGNKGDIDLVSVGVVYRFGRDTPARAATPPPLPATAANAVMEPVPTLVVVPVPALLQQYCSILDIQFEVDEDDIQREEKEKLGVLGTFLNKYPDTTAVIEGHTDNVGTSEENVKLSQRRADSVVSYLEGSSHIAPSRLKAVGYGETRPLADNRTEDGKRRNRRIDAVVACATDIQGLTVAPARLTMAMLIEFDQNKADIRPQYRDELRKVADFLKANPSVSATVEGHTGNLQASPELGMEISQRRAQNVVNYLVDDFGIARSRLSAEGFGKGRRFAYNTSLEGQQENRRVNIIFDYAR
jgi:OmpA-OmpF porin, OOP family